MKLQPKNTGKETGVRKIPVISKGYSVTHVDFCEDNMLRYLHRQIWHIFSVILSVNKN